jgi:hypothetical protein
MHILNFRIECPLIFSQTQLWLFFFSTMSLMQYKLIFLSLIARLQSFSIFSRIWRIEINLMIFYFLVLLNVYLWVYCTNQWDIDGRFGIIDEWEKHMIEVNRRYQKNQIGELQTFGNQISYHISKTNIRFGDQSRQILLSSK